MREIINRQQADILRALTDHSGITRLHLSNVSGVHLQKVRLEVPDLAERYLVECVTRPGSQAQEIIITAAGKKALEDYIKHQAWLASDQKKAPSSRRNLFELPVYSPPKSTYYRNSGSGHIPSRGF